MNSVLDSEGRHSGSEQRPAALYVCGGPGVGKTSAVMWCCEKVASERGTSDPQCLTPFRIYINVNHVLGGQGGNNVDAVRRQLSNILGVKNTKKAIRDHLIKNRKLLFLILDEVDAFIQCAAEKEFQTIMNWVHDEKFPMALIGISNTTGDVAFEQIQNIGEVSFKSL